MASPSTSGREEQKRDPFLVLESPHEKIKFSRTAKQYDVFINHRGPDVKLTLAQQLYDSLQKAGVRAYLDCQETELGEYFPSAIKNAIYTARVHIAILSPGYAESAWCLAELALMFQSKARIIPLFYHVPPADFRYIKNVVADAFSKLEKEGGRYPTDNIQEWKDCLQNISWLKGYEFKEQNEDPSKLCDVVSAVVEEKQKRKLSFQVAKYAVGLDEFVKEFHNQCQRNGEMRDKIVGIYGMGGSGKTTLAKELFKRKCSEFSGSTILFDVQEKDEKGELTVLQSMLLKDLFPKNHDPFCNIEKGVAYIKDYLQTFRESKFLVVLDNVNHQKQLDSLLPIDALNQNSLVIVTTRDKRLLKQAGVRFRYKMKKMNPEHSKELFCWHAFHSQFCKRGFDDLVNRFVKVCGGLPLALQVIGGHVFGSKKAYWRIQLDAVKAGLHIDIKKTLKISYDALEEDQKQIFMDIACFFIGEDKRRAISIWQASGWRAEHALQTLKDKCLVEEQACFGLCDRMDRIHSEMAFHSEPTFILKMHDHLRDLGREIADNEMSGPQRCWRPENLIGMQNMKGLQNILTEHVISSLRCSSHVEESGLHMTYFLGSSKTSTDLQWLQFQFNSSEQYIPEWIPLQNLHSLRVEGALHERLWERVFQVPLKLKELYYCFKGPYFPGSTQEMFITYLNELVSSFAMLKHLESLHLEFGSEILNWSIEWNWLLKSFRELTNLQTLELTSFKLKGEFPLSNRGERTDDRFGMGSLQAITLCNISETWKVSIHGKFCPTLKSLKLYSMTDLIEVDLSRVTTLEHLVLLNCGKLIKVLCNDLLEIEMFRIKLCPMIKDLPNFGQSSCLKRIYISHCWNLQDVSAIEGLKGLKRIWIANCPELKSIKAIEQLKGLKRIWIEECRKLQGVICLKKLKELKRIFIGHCSGLQNIQDIAFLTHLESIIIVQCRKLQTISGIEELTELKEMIIADSPLINCVGRLKRLPSELTILVGRSAMSDEDGFRRRSPMSMADGFCERPCSFPSRCTREEVQDMIRSSHETQHSFSTFISCAMLDGSPCIGSDICNGTKITLEPYACLRPMSLSLKGEGVVYACVVNEGRFSKYDSWMPSCRLQKAVLVGVKVGEERKTLPILQDLFAQLFVENPEYFEDPHDCKPQDFKEDYLDSFEEIDFDDLADYVDDDDDDDEDDEYDYDEEEP